MWGGIGGNTRRGKDGIETGKTWPSSHVHPQVGEEDNGRETDGPKGITLKGVEPCRRLVTVQSYQGHAVFACSGSSWNANIAKHSNQIDALEPDRFGTLNGLTEVIWNLKSVQERYVYTVILQPVAPQPLPSLFSSAGLLNHCCLDPTRATGPHPGARRRCVFAVRLSPCGIDSLVDSTGAGDGGAAAPPAFVPKLNLPPPPASSAGLLCVVVEPVRRLHRAHELDPRGLHRGGPCRPSPSSESRRGWASSGPLASNPRAYFRPLSPSILCHRYASPPLRPLPLTPPTHSLSFLDPLPRLGLTQVFLLCCCPPTPPFGSPLPHSISPLVDPTLRLRLFLLHDHPFPPPPHPPHPLYLYYRA